MIEIKPYLSKSKYIVKKSKFRILFCHLHKKTYTKNCDQFNDWVRDITHFENYESHEYKNIGDVVLIYLKRNIHNKKYYAKYFMYFNKDYDFKVVDYESGDVLNDSSIPLDIIKSIDVFSIYENNFVRISMNKICFMALNFLIKFNINNKKIEDKVFNYFYKKYKCDHGYDNGYGVLLKYIIHFNININNNEKLRKIILHYFHRCENEKTLELFTSFADKIGFEYEIPNLNDYEENKIQKVADGTLNNGIVVQFSDFIVELESKGVCYIKNKYGVLDFNFEFNDEQELYYIFEISKLLSNYDVETYHVIINKDLKWRLISYNISNMRRICGCVIPNFVYDISKRSITEFKLYEQDKVLIKKMIQCIVQSTLNNEKDDA